MKKLFLVLLIFSFALTTSIMSAAQGKSSITIKGSDTMVILAQRWAEVYMGKNKDVSIQVTGGGSGTGIAALINNTTDLANASRPIKDKEKEKIEEGGRKLIEIPVALDALSVYVNSQNPLNEIDIETLKLIFTGQIQNWKELGWDDKKIKIYSRENNSGTYLYFKEHVLGNENFSPYAQYMPGTASLLNAVKKDKYGIGYGGIGYLKGAKSLKVSSKKGEPAVEPTMENALSGKYPLSRYLYIYVTDDKLKDPNIKKYILWILSDEGQKIVDNIGYYPLSKKDRQNILAKIQSF